MYALLILSVSAVIFSAHSDRRHRRDVKEPMEMIFDNGAADDRESQCRNGGVFSGGRCHCIFPHTGVECTEFQCVHGMSIGLRFEPKSLLFNKPCICTPSWSGDLCEYHVSEKCSNYGEWKNGHCECIGYHFGPHCQFVSKCVNGKANKGRCACDDNWEGEYCHRIICHHGTADLRNKSMSCQCSKRYTGQYCDACLAQPYPVSDYPECEKIKKRVVHLPREPKKKPIHSNSSRVAVLSVAGCFLFVFLVCMAYASFKYSTSKGERDRRRELESELKERSAILQEAAKDKIPEEEDLPFARSWRWGSKRMSLRKSSFGNIFRLNNRESRNPLAASASANTFEPARIDTKRVSS